MAYEVLSNAEKRELYDRHGEQGIKEGGGGGGGGGFHSPTDLFDMFFGGGMSRGGHRGPRRTKNLMHQIQVRLNMIKILLHKLSASSSHLRTMLPESNSTALAC